MKNMKRLNNYEYDLICDLFYTVVDLDYFDTSVRFKSSVDKLGLESDVVRVKLPTEYR